MTIKTLPKTLFVKIEKPSNDEPYFVAADDVVGMVDVNEKIKIGRYELIETMTAEGVIKLS